MRQNMFGAVGEAPVFWRLGLGAGLFRFDAHLGHLKGCTSGHLKGCGPLLQSHAVRSRCVCREVGPKPATTTSPAMARAAARRACARCCVSEPTTSVRAAQNSTLVTWCVSRNGAGRPSVVAVGHCVAAPSPEGGSLKGLSLFVHMLSEVQGG